ncbi:MAG: hypothetical protein HQM10_15925 [Candidatus Riflebacteria bacterium]|nr:hypothetical protein [Candidatus Riflebacteria bacterium]
MFRNRAFSLIEIILVLGMAAVVAYPFTKMFSFGIQGGHETYEHIIGYNIARDKIEEIKSLPFDLVKSDFDNFRDLYRDRGLDFMDAYSTKNGFEKIFSDIFTEDRIKDDIEKEAYEMFKELYKNTYKREYALYPDETSKLRRVTDVDERVDTKVPPRLKKVIVKVFNSRGLRIAELATLVSIQK